MIRIGKPQHNRLKWVTTELIARDGFSKGGNVRFTDLLL